MSKGCLFTEEWFFCARSENANNELRLKSRLGTGENCIAVEYAYIQVHGTEILAAVSERLAGAMVVVRFMRALWRSNRSQASIKQCFQMRLPDENL